MARNRCVQHCSIDIVLSCTEPAVGNPKLLNRRRYPTLHIFVPLYVSRTEPNSSMHPMRIPRSQLTPCIQVHFTLILLGQPFRY